MKTQLTIAMITREALRVLENNLTFTRNVNRSYDQLVVPYVEGDEFYSDWALNSYYESWFDYRARRVRQRADQRAAELAKRRREAECAAVQRAARLEEQRLQNERQAEALRLQREQLRREDDWRQYRKKRYQALNDDALSLSQAVEYELDWPALRSVDPYLADRLSGMSEPAQCHDMK